jgi:pimeloyl-ACP methyl ester carboxylesterase
MPFFEISPTQSIHYLVDNPSGNPTVLLLHGLGADCTSWLLQIPDLVNAGYRVMAPDARGFGKSSYPGGWNSIRLMTEDFVQLVKATCQPPIHVIGLSVGGLHALQLCLDYPEMIAKVVLVNTFPSLRPENPRIWAYL